MSFKDRLRQPDWLAEVQTVCAVGLGLVGLAIVVPTAWALVGGKPVTVELSADSLPGAAGAATGLPGGATVAPGSTVEVQVADPSLHQLVAEAMTSLPTKLLGFAMLLMLLRTVARARRSDPFSVATVRQLRFLGVLVIVGGVAAGLLEALAMADLSYTVASKALYFVWNIPGVWVLAGFGFLAVAEVVNRGAAMREDLARVI
jgi:hypothetical protein